MSTNAKPFSKLNITEINARAKEFKIETEGKSFSEIKEAVKAKMSKPLVEKSIVIKRPKPANAKTAKPAKVAKPKEAKVKKEKPAKVLNKLSDFKVGQKVLFYPMGEEKQETAEILEFAKGKNDADKVILQYGEEKVHRRLQKIQAK